MLTWGVVQGGEGNVPILCPPQQDPGIGKAMPSKGLVLNQSWAGKAVSIKGHAPNPPPPRHEFCEAKPPALLLRIPQNYTNPSLLRIAQNYTNLSCVIPDHCEGWRAPGGSQICPGGYQENKRGEPGLLGDETWRIGATRRIKARKQPPEHHWGEGWERGSAPGASGFIAGLVTCH